MSKMINQLEIILNNQLFYRDQTQQEMFGLLINDFLRKSGWLESAKMKLPIRADKPIPWITYSALAFLEQYLSNIHNVLEFGGGFSTLFYCEAEKEVQCFETSLVWRNLLSKTIQDFYPDRVSKVVFLPDEFSFSRLQDYDNLQNFESSFFTASEELAFAKLIQTNDLVTIDGLFRNYFLDLCAKYAEEKTLVMLDNSDRVEYESGIKSMVNAGWVKIDFNGIGPINPYAWTTSFFVKNFSQF